MKKVLICLFLAGLCLAGPAAFSQNITNDDQNIYLTGSCYFMPAGTYTFTLTLGYVDPDNGWTPAPPITVTVVSSGGGTMTITRSSGSFPAPDNDGYWALRDADNGVIMLTGGLYSGLLFWYHNPDGSMQINCEPLPIWFSSFTGSLSGGNVNLAWTTDMEQATTYIEVYRAATRSSTAYYKIGQVTAAGNSDIQHNYTFTDTHPGATNYYYLKMLNYQNTPAIYSPDTISVSCSGCSYSPPSPVYCNFTINGPDHICNIEAPAAYQLSSPVPDYSTIHWSVDVPSAVKLNTYPNFDRTQATLLKKTVTGSVTLTATLSGCTNAISKTVIMGTPPPDIITDVECPNVLCWPQGALAPISYNWTLYNYTVTGMSYGSGYEFDPFIGDGNDYQISLQYTNACGNSATIQVGTFHCDPGTITRTGGTAVSGNPAGGLMPAPSSSSVVWPNPTNGLVSVALPLTTSGGTTLQPKIYQVKVVDAQGMTHKTFSYPGGVDKASVNIAGLASGIYILQIFDKQRWIIKQVVLTK